ncbi:MAG: hypothetical protein M3N13_02525 [Candidatus Eremiobacteraeota bacterium]|nr:hypothetical protein [Candidatus Eremiobacteraeota bacterium]
MTDWSTVAYPAWWVRRAEERRAILDVAVARLREAIATDPDLVAALVFASYATGILLKKNDLDVMVLTTLPAAGDPGLRHATIARRLALDVSCDLLVHEPAEFERLVTERAFVARARREGIWIDAASPR